MKRNRNHRLGWFWESGLRSPEINRHYQKAVCFGHLQENFLRELQRTVALFSSQEIGAQGNRKMQVAYSLSFMFVFLSEALTNFACYKCKLVPPTEEKMKRWKGLRNAFQYSHKIRTLRSFWRESENRNGCQGCSYKNVT